MFKQLARYTMKYQESDLHIGLCSSLTSACNNVGSCWPTMLRPFGRGFSLLNKKCKLPVGSLILNAVA